MAETGPSLRYVRRSAMRKKCTLQSPVNGPLQALMQVENSGRNELRNRFIGAFDILKYIAWFGMDVVFMPNK